jgi:hypothetical protein
LCIFVAYLMHIIAYSLHIACIYIAYNLHISCILFAYYGHILVYYCIFHAYIRIFYQQRGECIFCSLHGAFCKGDADGGMLSRGPYSAQIGCCWDQTVVNSPEIAYHACYCIYTIIMHIQHISACHLCPSGPVVCAAVCQNVAEQ